MARHLVEAGFRTRGFDVRHTASTDFSECGGVAAKSAADAASGADALVIMVVDATQARKVLIDDGALGAMASPAVVILTTTCPQNAVEDLAAEIVAAGFHFVDAPVSGGVIGAETGTLTIMTSGTDAACAAAAPILRAMGSKIIRVGATPGQGSAMKTVTQLLCGVHIAATAEALALADRMGIDPSVALDVLGDSAASSWMLRDRGPRMLDADPATATALDIFVKDLGIVLEAGRSARAALPIAAGAYQMFLAASGRGDGRADDSQVIRSYHVLNGSPAND